MDQPDVDPSLLSLVDTNFQIGREQLEEGNNLIPQITLLAEGDGGWTIIPIIVADDTFESPAKHYRLPIMVKSIWRDAMSKDSTLHLRGIVILLDIWMEKISIDEFLKLKEAGKWKPLSQKPGSTEVLLVQLIVEDKEDTYIWPYVRAETGIVFASEYRKESGTKSVVKGLWPL
jgi:hypothetical protein